MDLPQLVLKVPGHLVRGRWKPASLHLSGLGWSKSTSMSPVQFLIAFIHGSIHPLTNRLSHTRYREQVKCFLNCRPIFLGNQDSFVPLTHDDDRFVGLSGFVNQPIKVATRLSCCDSGHDAPLACSTLNQVYAFENVRQDERLA